MKKITKKIIIPFSISEYKKGYYKVEDKHGRKVRIAFTDLKSEQPILAAVEYVSNSQCLEVVRTYYKNGQYFQSKESDNNLILIKIVGA